MKEKELLRKLGEETIYSAKGHFKACDFRRKQTTFVIWCCAILSIIGLFDVDPCLSKVLNALGILGSMGLLIWNEGEGKYYRAKHKEAAEKYLALHKKIRGYYFLDNLNKNMVESINQQVIDFDQSEKPEIPSYARRMAKKAIEGKDPETDNWFLIN